MDALDLGTAPLGEISELHFRTGGRDFFADEAAVWARFTASWDGLTDAEWQEPGAAPSDAGGPDWSLLDHVAHVAAWQDLAIDYIPRALAGAPWPKDADYAGGDFDAFNEQQRAGWSARPPGQVREWLAAGHGRLLEAARLVPADVLVTPDVFTWVFMTLHGHQLDHLGVIEPWVARLRDRRGGGAGGAS